MKIKENQKKRNSSIESLKVLAMILVIVGHCIQTLYIPNDYFTISDYILDLKSPTISVSNLVLTILAHSGALGNIIFLICSSWFMVDDSICKYRKIWMFILDIWTVSVLFLIVSVVVFNISLPIKMVIQQLFPTLFSNNWYMSCYIILYLVHPFLNIILTKSDKKQLFRLIVTLITIYIVFNSIYPVFFPSKMTLWVTIYLYVGYAKKYAMHIIGKNRINSLMLIIGLVGWISTVLFLNTIGLYVSFVNVNLLQFNNGNNIFLHMIAFALFTHARQHQFYSPAINKFASLSIFIYIIHENMIVRTYLRPQIWERINHERGYNYILIWLVTIVLLNYLISFVIGYLYTVSVHKIVVSIGNILYVKFKMFWNRFETYTIAEAQENGNEHFKNS